MNQSAAPKLLLLASLLLATPSRAATVSGAVTIDGRGVADAVVYLEAATEGPAPTPSRVVMDQKNLAFVPMVLPVVRGAVVDFTNSDDVEHNVFSPSEPTGKFDLGTYRRGEARSIVFDKPGEALVLCNIHMEMAAHILVLRDPSFAVTDKQGRYQIAKVAPGSYIVRVWRGEWLPYRQNVDVTDQDSFSLAVELRR